MEDVFEFDGGVRAPASYEPSNMGAFAGDRSCDRAIEPS